MQRAGGANIADLPYGVAHAVNEIAHGDMADRRAERRPSSAAGLRNVSSSVPAVGRSASARRMRCGSEYTCDDRPSCQAGSAIIARHRCVRRTARDGRRESAPTERTLFPAATRQCAWMSRQ